MAKINASTILRHPESGEVISLAEGADVPDWAADLIGDHLVDGDEKPAARKPRSK